MLWNNSMRSIESAATLACIGLVAIASAIMFKNFSDDEDEEYDDED